MILKYQEEVEADRIHAGFAKGIQHDSQMAASLNADAGFLRGKIAAIRGQNIDYGLPSMMDAIFSEAELRQTKFAERSRRFSEATNFLFILGLGPSLTGQLSKEEFVSGAD